MTPGEFVQALADGGGTNLSDFSDDPDYCPVHSWEFTDLYHEDVCPAYAAKLQAMVQ